MNTDRRWRTAIIWAVQAILAISVMLDWTEYTVTGFIIPLNLQYVAIILLHRPILQWIGIDLTDLQSLLIGVGVALHPLAMVYDLYGAVGVWDHITHFYSGALVAAVILVILWSRNLSPRKTTLYSLLFILVTGTLWEFFELFISTNLRVHGFWDTFFDMTFNLLGWLTVLLLGKEPLSNITEALQER